MLRIGGYVMSFEDAAAWARRRFPGIDICDIDIIPSIIEEYAQDAEGLKLMVVPIRLNNKSTCVFITHCANDPYGTRTRFTPFPQDAFALELGKKLFLSKEELDNAEFVTVCDPY